ncbi:hypothetical protein B0H14DRAFT_3166648 [Mycena olivaceomarginata]|nr:hypothetical protein B0H14DRAFT_3166648 [Mycena olivaceomarginata]
MAYTRFDSGAVAHYIDDPDICADDSDSLPDLIADSGAPFESNALVLRGPRELSHTRGSDATRSGPSFWNQLIGTNHTVSALFNGTIGAAVFQPPPPSADDLALWSTTGSIACASAKPSPFKPGTFLTRSLSSFTALRTIIIHFSGARSVIPSSLPDAVLTELGIPMPAISLLRDERMGISYEFREYGSTSEALATLQVIYDVIDHYWLLVCYALFTSILHGFNSTLNFGALIGMSVHDFIPGPRSLPVRRFAPLTEYMADKQRANMIEFDTDSLLEAAPIPASARDVLSREQVEMEVGSIVFTVLPLLSSVCQRCEHDQPRPCTPCSAVVAHGCGRRKWQGNRRGGCKCTGAFRVLIPIFSLDEYAKKGLARGVQRNGWEKRIDVWRRTDAARALASTRSAFNDKAEFPEELLTDSFRSEVATLAYVRQQTSIPVPEVYYFDSDPRNPVGANNAGGEGALPRPRSHRSLNFDLSDRSLAKTFLVFGVQGVPPAPGGHCDPVGMHGIRAPSHKVPHHRRAHRRQRNRRATGFSSTYPFSLRDPERGPFSSAKDLLVAHAPEEWARERAKWSHVNGGFDDIPASYALQWLSLLSAAIVAMPSAAFKPADFALFHDDFTMGNMLVSDSGTVVGIIDWEGSRTLPLWNGSRHVGLLQDVNMFDDEVEMESLQRLRRNIIEEKTGQPYPVLSSLSLGRCSTLQTIPFRAVHPGQHGPAFPDLVPSGGHSGCEWELLTPSSS